MIRLGPPSPARDAARRASEDSVTVLVRNDTGASVPQFGVLALGDPLVLPEDSEPTFRQRRAFAGDTPSASSTLAILQEPLGAGAIGRAVVQGVTPVVLGDYLGQSRATADPDDPSRMLGGSTGARVIWAEPDANEDADGNRWGVVLLGADSPAVWDLRYWRQPDRWYPMDVRGWIAHDDSYGLSAGYWDGTWQGAIYLAPFVAPRGGTVSGIGIFCPVNNTGDLIGSRVRLGVYKAADAGGSIMATDLVVDGGLVDVDTAGFVSVALDSAIEPGLYWLAVAARVSGPSYAARVRYVDPTTDGGTAAPDTWYFTCTPLLGIETGSVLTSPDQSFINGYVVPHFDDPDDPGHPAPLPDTLDPDDPDAAYLTNIVPLVVVRFSSFSDAGGGSGGGGGGGGSGAPTDAQYVTLATNATLTNERVLTAGTGITLTDGGAGGAITIDATGGGGNGDDGTW